MAVYCLDQGYTEAGQPDRSEFRLFMEGVRTCLHQSSTPDMNGFHSINSEESCLISLQEVSEAIDEINHLIYFICQNVVGREEIVHQAFFAFLTGEHQLLLGRTGMAKSLLARQIFECCDQAKIFEKHLTKDTTPDILFGAYDMGEMKHGKMVHNVQDSIIMADFAFLDEIFDANDMLLRSLLSLLNERKLVNGEQIVQSPLNSVIAASNYIRSTEVLEAVTDRFVYKSFIPENKNLYYQYSIDQIYGENAGNIKSPEKRLDLDKLRKIKQLIKTQSIKIPDYILFLKNYILRQYIHETQKVEGGYDFTISDRTAAKVQDLLRASALLDERSTVEEQDLNNLPYLICMVGKQEEKIRLIGIIDTTKRYFSQDRELLYGIFSLINLFRIMKSSPDPYAIVEHADFTFLLKKVEQSFFESNLKTAFRGFFHKIKNLIHGIGAPPRQSKFVFILETFLESCVMLRDIATKRETLELIDGFESDINQFYQMHIKGNEGYNLNFSPGLL